MKPSRGWIEAHLARLEGQRVRRRRRLTRAGGWLLALALTLAACCVGYAALAQQGAKPDRLKKGLWVQKQWQPTGEKEKRIRRLLNCPPDRVVCCDDCETCICEDGLICPPLVRMYLCDQE